MLKYLIYSFRSPSKSGSKVIKSNKIDLATIKKKAQTLKQLNINDMQVKKLMTSGPFHFDNLQNINAERCNIKSIDMDFLLTSMNTLKTISMPNNSLENFPAVTNMGKLTTLKLSYNKLC